MARLPPPGPVAALKIIELHEKTLGELEKVDPLAPELDTVRQRLRGLYMQQLTVAESRSHWEKRMWLRCFHPVIEHYRLRSKKKKRRRTVKVQKRFKVWMADAKDFYGRKTTRLPSDLRARRLGDLARYEGHGEDARRHYAQVSDAVAFNGIGLLSRDEGRLLTAAAYFARGSAAANFKNLAGDLKQKPQDNDKTRFAKEFLQHIILLEHAETTTNDEDATTTKTTGFRAFLTSKLAPMLRDSQFSADRLVEMMVVTIYVGRGSADLADVIASTATQRPKNTLPALVLFADYLKSTLRPSSHWVGKELSLFLEHKYDDIISSSSSSRGFWLPERELLRAFAPLRPLYDTMTSAGSSVVVENRDLQAARLAALASLLPPRPASPRHLSDATTCLSTPSSSASSSA